MKHTLTIFLKLNVEGQRTMKILTSYTSHPVFEQFFFVDSSN